MSSNLEKQIIQLSNRQLIPELRDLIRKLPAAQLCILMEKRISQSDACLLWSGLLRGFDESEDSIEKRFACVKSFLKQINKVELSYKQTYDLLSILFLDLPSFPIAQLTDLAEYCIASLRSGDPKCVGWKDLLPEVMNILITKSSLPVNGVLMTGIDYRSNMIKNLCNMQWPAAVLTPIGNMFRNMNLTNDEITTVITKFCYSFKQLDPLELPPLCFQLFSMCNTAAQIMIAIISLQRYFYEHYYKKLYADMESENTDFNSIDKYSDKELREAEETIFNHLNYCTQFKIKELQILVVLRNLLSSPDVILTPFVLNSILSMARINRDPDIRLSSSLILLYLRNVIAKNEEEKHMVKVSAWCRDTLQTKQANLENIFTILIDQNKDGKDFVTPGLVNLAFTLLRAKNSPELNALAISFLRNFLKKRFVFGQGMVKNIAEWMILEQDANQYSECLTILSNTDTFTVSECVRTIKYLLDFFLCIPGLTAMRMMSFILPIIRISHVVRDSFIDIMKKAMYSREIGTCKMGVYGFCMLLKSLNNTNSQRAAIRSGTVFTQQSISGFSLMSQTILGNHNNPERHFDMLTLEVIGILRNCFNQSLEIKTTLYESLTRSIEINPKLIPHVLQFIDWHFRSYFEVSDSKCEIKFDKIIRHQTTNENDIEVCDSLGKLTNFVAFCVLSCNKHKLNYDTSTLMNLFEKLMEMVCIVTPEDLGITGTITQKINQMVLQYVGLIEALMNYALWTSNRENNNVKTLHRLFKNRQKICNELKSLLENQSKKTGKKGKDIGTESQSQDCTINGTVSKRIIFKPESVYDLPSLERFLRFLYDDCTSFAQDSHAEQLRTDRHLVQFVTRTAVDIIAQLRNEPEYKQLSHSRRCFKNLINISKCVYESCIKRLPYLWNTFDVLSAYYSAECLKQCLLTANSVFKRKFAVFLQEIDYEYASDDNAKKITAAIQKATEMAIEDKDLYDQPSGDKIPVVLFQCLEILYDYIPYDDELCLESYHWIFNFCQSHELKTKELAIANKILFSQRMKTHTGAFFTTIAIGLQKYFQKINYESGESDPQFELKSISEANAELTLIYLMNVVCKQIADVEYFIMKAKSLQIKVKITSEADREQSIEQLKITEKSICSQLIHIVATLLQLTNSSVPLGTVMDNLVKCLMEFYICLTNLTKHLITRHGCIPMSFQGTKFDQLLRSVGKPLAINVYGLITYLEENILQDKAKKKDAQANKAKVLKETKLLPKLILRMENFSKFVILLSKKTQAHISHYLHIGTVRDFRIKTSELKDAIDRSLSYNDGSTDSAHGDQTEDEIEDLSDIENDNLQESTTTNAIVDCPSSKRTTRANATAAAIRLSSKEVVDKEADSETSTQVLKNLEKLNAKVRKKKSSENVATDEPKQKKRKTKRCKN